MSIVHAYTPQQARALVAQYESLDPEALHRPWRAFLPKPPASILDLGAGSGRDAAWLAEMGHQVVAAEPSPAMRQQARALHPRSDIRWVPEGLPRLDRLSQAGLCFDLILAGAVWMHLPPADRPLALQTLARLLASAGILVITLRHGPMTEERTSYPIAAGETDGLAQKQGLRRVKRHQSRDQLKRETVFWETLVFRFEKTAFALSQ